MHGSVDRRARWRPGRWSWRSGYVRPSPRHFLSDCLQPTHPTQVNCLTSPQFNATQQQALADALALRASTEEEAASWLSSDEAEGGAVVQVAEREDIPLALDQHERRMPWDRRCVPPSEAVFFVFVFVVWNWNGNFDLILRAYQPNHHHQHPGSAPPSSSPCGTPSPSCWSARPPWWWPWPQPTRRPCTASRSWRPRRHSSRGPAGATTTTGRPSSTTGSTARR